MAGPDPPRDAVDDRVFLPRLDRLVVCDLDAILVAEKLWRRSQEIRIPLHGYAVFRVSRRTARRSDHRLPAAPHPEPADCALADDRRQLGPRRGGAGTGDSRPRPGCRAGPAP